MDVFCSSRLELAGLQVFLIIISFLAAVSAGNFYEEFDITWGDDRVEIHDDGKLLLELWLTIGMVAIVLKWWLYY